MSNQEGSFGILDIVAAVLAAVMILGPLSAVMIGSGVPH
jgi:hypothetical protein